MNPFLSAVLLRLVAVVALVSVASNSGATELTITNQSFETPVLADGAGGAVLSVPGWSAEGVVQIINPYNAYFSGTSDGAVGSPVHGTNAVAINNVPSSKLTYQNTNWVIQPDVVYTLSFLAGRRIGIPFGSPTIGFWSGTNLLAQTIPDPPENTFTRFSLNYTSPPVGQLLGTPLRFEIRPGGTDTQPWFDDFHLFTASNICTPHAARASAQVINGFVVGAVLSDSGCGYTNAPSVTITGGGGNGAIATATVSNGVVVAITVTAAGCCYTNAPTISIGSPPFVPEVSISVSRVNVTQRVMLGRRYVLESSNDLTAWTEAGTPFTAESETVVSEFEVNAVGRYFRLREVP
jgi:hypothetical protein